MPPAKKKKAADVKPVVNEVDDTVKNQENPVIAETQRESTEEEKPAEYAKQAKANEVDETVENQEAPGRFETVRESTEPGDADPNKSWDKLAEANEVDDVVKNQMNPGTFAKDRNPEPEIREDDAGIKYDVSKPYPELIREEDSPEEQQRRARLKQTNAVLNAKNVGDTPEEDKREYIEIEFLEPGLTTNGSVWKKGQILKMEDNEDTVRLNKDVDGNVWFEMSASEQEERYGKVFFKKR